MRFGAALQPSCDLASGMGQLNWQGIQSRLSNLHLLRRHKVSCNSPAAPGSSSARYLHLHRQEVNSKLVACSAWPMWTRSGGRNAGAGSGASGLWLLPSVCSWGSRPLQTLSTGWFSRMQQVSSGSLCPCQRQSVRRTSLHCSLRQLMCGCTAQGPPATPRKGVHMLLSSGM